MQIQVNIDSDKESDKHIDALVAFLNAIRTGTAKAAQQPAPITKTAQQPAPITKPEAKAESAPITKTAQQPAPITKPEAKPVATDAAEPTGEALPAETEDDAQLREDAANNLQRVLLLADGKHKKACKDKLTALGVKKLSELTLSGVAEFSEFLDKI